MILMKKLVVMALALLLICAAAAAETLDVKPEDFTLDLSQRHELQVDILDEDSFADGGFSVAREGSKYIVNDGDTKYTLDLAENPTFLCFTQDMMASFEAYLRISDPNGLQNMLVSEGVSYFLVDSETNMQVYIYPREGDHLSSFTGDLSKMTKQNQELIASMMGVDASALKTAGDTTWVIGNESLMLTIFNNKYIIVEFGGTGDPAGDLEDTLNLMSYLDLE